MNLLAMAVGKKQKQNVNEIVKKVICPSWMPYSQFPILIFLVLTFDNMLYLVLQFPSTDFVVMLFHYDGIVDEWRDFEWSSRAIHVSAINQTKW